MTARAVDSGAVTTFPHLFSPIGLGTVTLRNRIVMPGHGTRFVDWHGHHVVRRQADYLAERARGGVAMIVQGSAMVHPTGLATGGIDEIWSDDSIPSYRMLADDVHEHGTAILGQLSHLGRQGHTFASHRELWAPSAIPDPSSRVVRHAMTKREIRELVRAYAGATRFLAAGIEVYLAHRYLLCSFMSSFSSSRTDEYGGSPENRLRRPLEVLDAVRAAVGADTPVGVRVSADEFSPGGLDVDETCGMVERLLDATPLEYISVSQSNYTSISTMIPDMSYAPAPFVHYAGRVRSVARGVPVMAVARIVTPERCEEIIERGTADIVCLARPLIADPELPEKARTGRRDEIRECISCNVGCRGGPHRGMAVACLVNPAVGYEATWGAGKIAPAEPARRVVVVGGGPAGLKAAETAALRGHRVALLEADDRLGGQVLVAAAAMPYRDEFANSVRFLARQQARLDVDVRTGTRATVATVAMLEPDVVVVSTGARPGRPAIPGGELTVTASDAISSGVDGERVVVLDSGGADWKALTTAERLAADGHEVTIVSPVPIGAEIDAFSRPPLLRRLRQSGVEFLEHHTAIAVAPGTVTVRESFTGDERPLPADAVVATWYGVADDSLFHALDGAGADVRAVGDCVAPRRTVDAIWDGFPVGVEI